MSLAKGGAPVPDKSECALDVAVDAFIPESYIPRSEGRIEAYKRIAGIENQEDAGDVLDELIDRYGDTPQSVSSLVEVSLARATASRVGILKIMQKNDALLLYSGSFTAEKIKAAAQCLPGKVTFSNAGKPYLSVRLALGEKPMEILNQLLAVLDALPLEEKTEKPAATEQE